MPLYEFDCPECGEPFEKLVRSASKIAEVVCPNCSSPDVKKRMSTIAVRSVSSGSLSINTSSAASCAPSG